MSHLYVTALGSAPRHPKRDPQWDSLKDIALMRPITQILVLVLPLVSWVAWHILVESQTLDLAAHELYEGRTTVFR